MKHLTGEVGFLMIPVQSKHGVSDSTVSSRM